MRQPRTHGASHQIREHSAGHGSCDGDCQDGNLPERPCDERIQPLRVAKGIAVLQGVPGSGCAQRHPTKEAETSMSEQSLSPEGLLKALRDEEAQQLARDGEEDATERAALARAARLEIERLREYEWMYKELSK